MQILVRNISDIGDPLVDYLLMESVSKERQVKIKRLKQEADRKRCLAAGLIMEQMIRNAGLEVDQLHYGSHGKPMIIGLEFSISHSGEYAFGVSDDSAIGCDVERIRLPKEALLRKIFTDKEQELIHSSDDKELTFTRLWSMKEAYVKYTGEGLSRDLASFMVQDLNGRPYIQEESGDVLYLHTKIFDGHVFTICSKKEMIDF